MQFPIRQIILTVLSINTTLVISPVTAVLPAPSSVKLGIIVAQTSQDIEAEKLLEEADPWAEGATVEVKQKKILLFQRALKLYETSGNKEGQALTLLHLGKVHDDLGEKKQALTYYQQSLALWQQIDDQWGKAAIFNNMGMVYNDFGEKQTALDYYQQSLILSEAIDDQSLNSRTIYNMAMVYSDLGEKEKALEYYQKSLPLFAELNDQLMQGRALTNIALIYKDLGEETKALKYLAEAEPFTRDTGDRSTLGRIYNNFGIIYNDQENTDKALAYYQKSLPIAEEVGDRFLIAVLLHNMGVIHDGKEEWDKALEYYEKSLPIARSLGDRTQEALTLNNIGLVHSKRNEPTEAIKYYEKSLALAQAVQNPMQEAMTLYNLANLKFSQGEYKEALSQIKKAVAIVEKLRTNLVNKDLRTNYFATVHDYYVLYIDILMNLHYQEPDQGYDQQALNISERTKARGLLELLTESQINIRQGVDINLLDQEKSLITQLNQVENDRLKYSAQSYTNSHKIKEVSAKIDQLLSQLDQIETQIKKTSPRYAQLTQPNILTVQQIQDEILDEKTVLLEYLVGTQASYLWVVSKNNLTTYMIPGKQELKQAVNEFRRILTHPRTQNNLSLIQAKANELSEMILAPASQEIKDKRLLIVSDGPLQYIPFAALAIPGNKNNYQPLISQHTMINLPSASTLAMIRQDTANRPLAPKKIAVIADPVFSPDDQRLTQRPRTNLDDAIAMVDISRGTDTAGIIWERLPFTRQEAEAITALVPDNDSKKVLDFQADYRNVMAGELSQYQIIHLATHGFVNTEQPELSALVLSLFNQQGMPENGYLRLNDIFNLNLPAELVVLSACQTGLGKEIKGEGLIGLTRGFMYAGARRVLVSLWNVNDQKTAELMTIFYKKMLQENINPAESFRLAQVEMWQKGYSPYYWAPFVVQGEPGGMDRGL